jgi:phospholipid/cholesterol/gamma-HCH transport system ATP-binding protein
MLDREAQGMIALGKPKELRAESRDPTVRAFFNRETL